MFSWGSFLRKIIFLENPPAPEEQKICHPSEQITQGITRVIATILRNFRVGVNVRENLPNHQLLCQKQQILCRAMMFALL